MDVTDSADLIQHLRTKLTEAMRARDREIVMALRDALAALANAEAVPAEEGTPSTIGDEHFAGSKVGVGAGEAAPLTVDDDGARRIIHEVIIARRHNAADLDAQGRRDEAAGLRRGADALESFT